ncbi:protein ALP1-like [Melitaea cinxia]|uniref:protein ALP1-like n=1 Tax=Melitaea cinxia TaxID=113334 RepID=UPI001E2729C0|nr:protein ALP1-like [Melitaea cinxia]
MPELTTQRLKKIAREYEFKANFPHCVGAMDGKHIRMIKPNRSGSLFFNYKEFFSIVLFAVVDASYMFTYIDVGSYGKECDSTIFQNSTLYGHPQHEQIKLPHPEPLSSTRSGDMLFVFVADEAFGLSPYIMRPYSGRNLPTPKRVFNYRLSRARRYVECAFGILSNKWRIFHRPLNVNTDLAIDIVKCCCILHNFVRARDGGNASESIAVVDYEDVIIDITQSQAITRVSAANMIRDMFPDYFMSEEGALPWQLHVI